MRSSRSRPSSRPRPALTIGALGVVYGDIGTSPLYAFGQAFTGPSAVAVERTAVLGVCSLVVWSLLIIVTGKYLSLVLRADRGGEGGILSLLSLIDLPRLTPPVAAVVGALGIFGTGLLYGDGVITPAISVLSAVEGFEVAVPGVAAYTVEAAVTILVVLFAVQRFGTGRIGGVFGPVMILWFLVIAALGLRWVVASPDVLRALSPTYAVDFLLTSGARGFLSLGAVFLAVTGAEALYADLGHFGRRPIRRGWYFVVLPSLVLAYLGQGASLLDDPARVSNPFFMMAPAVLVVPLAVLATLAAVIASQALISAVFSLTAQAVHQGYAPALRTIHTSRAERGQIYVPAVNWTLLVLCVGVVVAFKSSARLGDAYGVAVVSTMSITTTLLYLVIRQRWGWSRKMALAVCTPLLLVDLAFLTANIPKIPTGGWLPLLMGLVAFTALSTWRRGRELVQTATQASGRQVATLLSDLRSSQVRRVPGTAIYLHRVAGATPPALLVNLHVNHVLHEQVVLVTLVPEPVATVPDPDVLGVVALGQGIWEVTLHRGFSERLDVPAGLSRLSQHSCTVQLEEATYYLTSERILSTAAPGMAQWRERLFSAMSRASTDVVLSFGLPPQRVVEIGHRVEI